MTDRDRELPYPDDPGGTHWDGCWRARGHHNCAVIEIERLQAALLRVEPPRFRPAELGPGHPIDQTEGSP